LQDRPAPPERSQARVLLINYWKESGQLQNVQILSAQLEQMNPDDRPCSRDLISCVNFVERSSRPKVK
jgi:hypothetical protein